MTPEGACPRLPLPGKAPALYLAQSLRAAQDGNGAHDARDGQHLEQVPAAVVQEEDALHGEDRPEEGSVRQRGGADGLLQVAEVRAENEPL